MGAQSLGARPWPKTGGRVPGPWLIWARRQFWAKAWPFGASPYVSTIHMYAYVSICVRMCPYVCIPCPMSPVLRPVSCVLTHLRRSTFVSF